MRLHPFSQFDGDFFIQVIGDLPQTSAQLISMVSIVLFSFHQGLTLR